MNLAAYDNERFRIIRALGQRETEAALEAMRILVAFHNDQQMLLVVRMNRIALDSAHAQYLAELRETHGMGPSRLSFVSLDLNRHLLNLLSSFVGFIDHAEVALSRRHGKESAEFKCFKTATSDEYDDVFAYRFLYRLRNYALHFELPLHQFQASSDASDPSAPTDELTFWHRRVELA